VRVLVTGGAGFVGSHVLEALTGHGHDVVVLDDGSTGSLDLARSLVGPDRLVTGDVRDPERVWAAVDGAGAVVHLAARVGLERGPEDLPEYVSRNDLGTAVVLAAAARARVPRVVLASSMVVYGEGGYTCETHGPARPPARDLEALRAGRFDPPCPGCGRPLAPVAVDETARLDPRNGYAASKVAQEHLCAAWCRATGGVAVALRLHNVYGPRMPRDTPYAGVAGLFRSALLRGAAPQVFEDGAQQRDFVHVRDVALATVRAVTAVLPTGAATPLNVASGVPRSVGDLAGALSRAMGGPAPQVTGQFRSGDVRHVVASPRRAEQVLGFRAEVGLEEGMRDLAGERRLTTRPAPSPGAPAPPAR
jgi:dTDP-L-rhamnose 4-epimerase